MHDKDFFNKLLSILIALLIICLMFLTGNKNWYFSQKKVKILVIVQLKRYIANTCIFGIIVSKLNYWSKTGSIILLKVNKRLKVDFYNAYLLFYVAINLKIKYDK